MDELVGQRKMAKKLQLRAKLIRDRESITYDPLRIFPLEIWEHIFSFISCDDPGDVFRMTHGSPMLRGVMGLHNPLVRLPEVLCILQEQGYSDKTHNLSKIRLVSKWCRSCYDWAFFERRFSGEDWHLAFDEDKMEFSTGVTTFHLKPRSTELARFIARFGSIPNPKIWTRRVKILDTEAEEEGGWTSEKVERFLEMFGDSIWSLHVHVRGSLSGIYTKVCRWAAHLVNLKVLIITCWTNANVVDNEAPLNEIYGSKDLELLRNAPKFPHIPSLVIYKGHGAPFSCFAEKILCSNPGMKVVLTAPRFPEAVSSYFLRNCSKMEAFYYTTGAYHPPPHLVSLLYCFQLAGCQWPLKIINLSVRPDTCNVSDLIRFLNVFKATLEQVFINLVQYFLNGNAYSTEVAPDLNLDLPKARVFQFQHFKSFFPFRLLYTMGSLEKLDLVLHLSEQEQHNADPHGSFIDFYPCYFGNRVWESNIWEFFSNLMEVRLKRCFDDSSIFQSVETKFEKKTRNVLEKYEANIWNI